MNLIPSEKCTKAELLKIIELKNSGIEHLKKEIEKEQARTQDANYVSRQHGERVQRLLVTLKESYLTNLSDMKSLSNFLSIYENEHMTHREKKYLGTKLRQVIDKLIEDKMSALNFAKNFTTLEEDLPF